MPRTDASTRSTQSTGRPPIAVVLVSGGLDSCVTAAHARNDGFDLAFLHGNYGHRTQARELVAYEAIADHFGITASRRLVIDLPHLGVIGGSSLTDLTIPVEVSPLVLANGANSQGAVRGPHDASSTPGAAREGSLRDARDSRSPGGNTPLRAWSQDERGQDTSLGVGWSVIPSSYVPFRNAHFLTAAVSWAEVLGASAIYIGAVEEDSSGYPDCRKEFFRAFETVIDLGTRPETRIALRTPLIDLDKEAIVRLGLDLEAPLELTWSCYSEATRACGVCDSCVLRLRGFARAGVADPIPYQARP